MGAGMAGSLPVAACRLFLSLSFWRWSRRPAWRAPAALSLRGSYSVVGFAADRWTLVALFGFV